MYVLWGSIALTFAVGLYAIARGAVVEPPAFLTQLANRVRALQAAPAAGLRPHAMVSRTLIRYFGMRFLGAVMSVFFGIFVLIVLVDYIELMRRAADVPNLSPWMVAKTSFFRVPQLTERLLPFSVLVGAMACYLALSRRNELVVARAAGMSAWQFVTPAVIVAFALGIVATAIYNPLSALMREWSKQLEAEMFGDKKNVDAAAERARLLGAPAQRRGPIDRLCGIEPGTGRSARRRQRLHLRPCRKELERIEAKTRDRSKPAIGGSNRPESTRSGVPPRDQRDLSGQDQPDRGASAGKLFDPRNGAVLGASRVYRDRRALRTRRRRL